MEHAMTNKGRLAGLAAGILLALSICLVAAAPSEAEAATKLAAPTIAKVAPFTTHQLKVTVNPVENASGYTVLYSPYKSFKTYKSVSSTKTTIQVKSLSPCKKYYVKVRAYKKNASGSLTRSAWSKPGSATTYTYAITYNLNGGTWGYSTPRYGFYKSSATFSLKNPTRPGYTFAGWYTTKSCSGTQVRSIAKGTAKNMTLYAKWNSSISYEIKDGVAGYGAYAQLNRAEKSITVPAKLGGADVVSFYCRGRSLSSLDVSQCTALKRLDCRNNKLTSLDVSNCMALQSLDCRENRLKSLNIAGCTALQYLYCQENSLTALNVSSYTALSDLLCHNNKLTSLNVAGCTALISLNCANNNLTTLDVSSCTSLTGLTVDENVTVVK